MKNHTSTIENQTSRSPASRSWQLFFDLDGTLSDPSEGMAKSFQHAMRCLGRPAPPESELTQYIGPPLRWTMPRLLGSDDPALIEQAVKCYRQRYSVVGLFENVVYEGIPALLEALQSDGFPLYVVTSKPTVIAERIIRRFGLDGHFIGVFGPEFDGHYDDKRDLVAHALKALSIPPAQTIMIGDRAIDVLAGKANGTRTVALTYGFAVPGELAATSPDRVCANPAEIRQAILSLAGSEPSSRWATS